MIHISERAKGNHSIIITVDGRIDRKSLTSLKDVCEQQISSKKHVLLDLEGITHTDESGREYIKFLKNRVEFLNVPEFLKLEINLELKA